MGVGEILFVGDPALWQFELERTRSIAGKPPSHLKNVISSCPCEKSH
jgi:hypothetical protein